MPVLDVPLPRGNDGRQSSQYSPSYIENMIVESSQAGGVRSGHMLMLRPGLNVFSNISSNPCRGLIAASNSLLYVVEGTNLRSVASNGTTTILGTIPGTSPVRMAFNGTHLVVTNGANGYVWDYSTSNFQQVSDSVFVNNYNPASDFVYIDTYIYGAKSGSRLKFLSNVNNPLVYDINRQLQSDNILDSIVGLACVGQNVFVIGEDYTEVDRNTGVGNFPFTPISGGIRRFGCAAKNSIAIGRDKAMWLGKHGFIHVTDNADIGVVDIPYLRTEIANMATVSDCIGQLLYYLGHEIYLLTFPTEQKTYAFDLTEGVITRFSSAGTGYWRGVFHAHCFGKNYAADYSTGIIYEVTPNHHYDGASELITWIFRTGYIHAQNAFITHNEVEFACQTGIGAGNANENAVFSLSYSDDGGVTYKTAQSRTVGNGIYDQRVRFHSLGQSSAKGRIYQATGSAAVAWAFFGMYITTGQK